MIFRSPRFEFGGEDFPLLTENRAMGCWSWSIPAVYTCPGMDASSDNHICSGCYARIGRYAMPAVARPQAARLAWTRELLDSDPQQWIDRMVAALEWCGPFFRGHDSGDFWSVEYALAWFEICERTPRTQYWFPTRSYRVPKLLPYLRNLHALENVVVTPSALQFDDAPPEIVGLGPGQSAHTDAPPEGCRDCPKTWAGSCDAAGCRDCWDADASPVSFQAHGHGGTHRPTPPSRRQNANRAAVVREFVPLNVLEGLRNG